MPKRQVRIKSLIDKVYEYGEQISRVTILKYEKQGLLPKPNRSISGARLYDVDVLDTLALKIISIKKDNTEYLKK